MKMTILSRLRKIYYFFLQMKKEYYLATLVNKGMRIGDNVSLMDGCFFDPSHCYLISIGNNCILAPNVRLIAHDASMKRSTGYARIGLVRIGDDCFIGDSTIILPGVDIGSNSIIGSGSVVTKNIPSDSVAVGNPCKRIDSTSDYIERSKADIKRRKVPYAEYDHITFPHDKQKEVINFLKQGRGYTI